MCINIHSRYKVQQPDSLHHNRMTNTETELEKHTIRRVRSTGSALSRNYGGTKGKTMQKLTRTC